LHTPVGSGHTGTMWWWKNTAISLNRRYAHSTAEELVAVAVRRYGQRAVLTTSFGIQSAVMLHIVSVVAPDIPVIWIDTGYLPSETYRYAETLTSRFNLNLQVYQSVLSPARMEAVYGRLWEEPDPAALDRYHQIRKVEPLHRAFRELRAKGWIAGVRSVQTDYRKSFRRVQRHGRIIKFHPLLDWSQDDVARYMERNRLPHHPLTEEGYVTVGDAHLSRPVKPTVPADEAEIRATRFDGRKAECGIHLDNASQEHGRSVVGGFLSGFTYRGSEDET
jgi:phosphoadenosine phosphosulfate reductase